MKPSTVWHTLFAWLGEPVHPAFHADDIIEGYYGALSVKLSDASQITVGLTVTRPFALRLSHSHSPSGTVPRIIEASG